MPHRLQRRFKRSPPINRALVAFRPSQPDARAAAEAYVFNSFFCRAPNVIDKGEALAMKERGMTWAAIGQRLAAREGRAQPYLPRSVMNAVRGSSAFQNRNGRERMTKVHVERGGHKNALCFTYVPPAVPQLLGFAEFLSLPPERRCVRCELRLAARGREKLSGDDLVRLLARL